MEHISTLKHYKQLRHAGYTDIMAEAAVNALNESFDGVATKEDLKSLEKDLKTDIKNLELRIESKMDAKFNTINKLGWAIFLVICLPALQNILPKIDHYLRSLFN